MNKYTILLATMIIGFILVTMTNREQNATIHILLEMIESLQDSNRELKTKVDELVEERNFKEFLKNK